MNVVQGIGIPMEESRRSYIGKIVFLYLQDMPGLLLQWTWTPHIFHTADYESHYLSKRPSSKHILRFKKPYVTKFFDSLMLIQWNLSVTTTPLIGFIVRDKFRNVF